MVKEQSSIDLGYPIFGAKFINNKTVLVIGGGGEGSNGIPNKITALKCSFKTNEQNRIIQKFREIQLPSNEDSPQTLDFVKTSNSIDNIGNSSEYQILVGCNQSSQLIKSMNINNNVRKYKYNDEEHLIFEDAAQFEEELDGDSDEYPKIIKLASNNSIGCIMTSKLPSTLYFFNPITLELKFKYKTNNEIKDFEFNKDGCKLYYITSSSIVTYSTETNSIISEKKLADYKLSKIKLINDSELLVSATFKNKGAYLFKYNLSNGKITKEQLISSKFNNIVALDLSNSQGLIAVAGNDLSLTLLQLTNLKIIKTFKKLHPFAITCVSFSPNGTKLATGSAANILNVIRIPPKYLSKKSFSAFGVIGTLVQYLFTIVLMIFIAFGLQKFHEAGKFNDLMNYTENYREYGLEYGKILYDYAGNYGKVAYNYAENYGKVAYDVAEEYGKKYGSKALEVYIEKFGKANHEQDFKNTLNDIVSEVTKNFDKLTNAEFDSATLDQVKLTTSILSTDSSTNIYSSIVESPKSIISSKLSSLSKEYISSATEQISADPTTFNEVEPELEKPIEILNNLTANEEQLDKEITKEREDRIINNKNKEEEFKAATSAEASSDPTFFDEVEPELVKPIEILNNSTLDSEQLDQEITKEREDRINKNKQESENLAKDIPNYEDAKIEKYEDDTNTELKPNELEEETILPTGDASPQDDDDEVVEEIIEVVEEDGNDDEQHQDVDDAYSSDEVEIIEEIEEIEEVEEPQEEDLPAVEETTTDTENIGITSDAVEESEPKASGEELIEVDTEAELPLEVSTGTEEPSQTTASTSAATEEPIQVDVETEEVKYTPEEPTPIESQITVEVSGTGRDEPTLNEEEVELEVETFESPLVEISTPSTEAMPETTTELEPAKDEPSIVEPTSSLSASSIDENKEESSNSVIDEVKEVSTNSPIVEPETTTTSTSTETTESTTTITTTTQTTTSNQIKTKTKKITRTIKKTSLSKPTKNPIEKDEL
ncbi:SED4 [Candida jiufengensis]|uniref:SED4 n=1 Tax=Candida jiufengensis TaxID=497108 RepID=UPI00222413A6|nr:SED4 [Candida jiufengensis]KAI5956816.1 SED4 [Candida jiufengensis]